MDKIVFSLGPISISWYSLCILTGVILAYALINSEAKKNNIPSAFITNLVFWCMIFGILGARLYYVLFNLNYYLDSPLEIFKIWNGGLAIHGGIIAGLITLILYCRKYNVNILKMLDIVVPALILAQGIGRWGNFFNGEAHGTVVSRAFLENLHLPNFIIDGMHIGKYYYHPTFLYESVFDLLGCLVLLGFRSVKNTKLGNTTSVYLMWYGIVRFFVEGFRTDSLMLGSLRIAQVVSILMIITGFVMYIITTIKCKRYDEEVPKSNEIIY